MAYVRDPLSDFIASISYEQSGDKENSLVAA